MAGPARFHRMEKDDGRVNMGMGGQCERDEEVVELVEVGEAVAVLRDG